jgi:hypothetical protein
MTADDPSVFENIGAYMRARLMIASAIIFRKSGWNEWTYGHEKLMGVILWYCEAEKQCNFKYSKVLKRYAYGRTQNYKLLKEIVDRNILIRQPNGYYIFPRSYRELIEQIFEELKNLDRIGIQEKGESESENTVY